VAAITSGTDTSIDAKTHSDGTSEHVASEKVAFFMIESIASSNSVALKSSHVIPAIPSDTATTGARAGLGVGTGGGCAVVGTGVGTAVGKGGGADDGTSDGAGSGTAVGVGSGTAVGAGRGTAVGADSGTTVGTGSDTAVGAADGAGNSSRRRCSTFPGATGLATLTSAVAAFVIGVRSAAADAAEPKIAIVVLSSGVAVAGPDALATLVSPAPAAMEPYE